MNKSAVYFRLIIREESNKNKSDTDVSLLFMPVNNYGQDNHTHQSLDLALWVAPTD